MRVIIKFSKYLVGCIAEQVCLSTNVFPSSVFVRLNDFIVDINQCHLNKVFDYMLVSIFCVVTFFTHVFTGQNGLHSTVSSDWKSKFMSNKIFGSN
jgi:hypothetical protein